MATVTRSETHPGVTSYEEVNRDVLKFVVRSLDGQLELPENPDDPGSQFFSEALQGVQQVITDVGMGVFLEDARGHAAGYGGGSPLDLSWPSDMLHIAASIDATEFDGVVHRDDLVDLASAVKWTLMAIYEDVFSAVGAAIEADELGWDDDRLVVTK